MSFIFRQRFYPANYSKIKEKGQAYGYTRPGVVISKSLTDSLSFSMASMFAVYQRSSAAPNLGKNYLYFTPTLAYQINSKWSVSMLNELIHINRVGDVSSGDLTNLDSTFTLGYSLSDSVSLGFNVGVPILRAHDGQILAENTARNMSYSIDATISAF